MYHKYCLEEERFGTTVDTSVQSENLRQREYQEGIIRSLKHRLEKGVAKYRNENLRVMKENAALIEYSFTHLLYTQNM